jgi:CHAD domain-containing protein
MAFAVAIATRAPIEHRDLAYWMSRALEELGELRSDPSVDAVHDFRVALRRCRSVAAAVAEIDPHPDWGEMRGCARKVFRSMGELRDAQMAEEWLEQLVPEPDPVKLLVLDSVKRTQGTALAKALHFAERFDGERWAELAKVLCSRLRKIPVDGEAARCLALERLEEAHELHRRALRTESAAPWHQLRIGLKRFRYTLELLVPSLHAKWIPSLKRVQDLLGDVHDLDTLVALAGDSRGAGGPGLEAILRERVEVIRQEKLQAYRQQALGSTSIWQNWQAGFPKHDWPANSAARIKATRRAMDRKPARSLAVSRIARKLWAQLGLRLTVAGPIFADADEKRVLSAAALLSGIARESKKKSRLKAARTFLLRSPVPPAWTFAEWERVAWTVRFQRGAEPAVGNKRFSGLSIEQQVKIRTLAGILRLAVAAQRSGVTSGAPVKISALPQGLLLHLEGVEETPEIAARFAKAKHLLEVSIGKSILVQPTKVVPPAPAKDIAPLLPVVVVG